jgi:hypothetical protein
MTSRQGTQLILAQMAELLTDLYPEAYTRPLPLFHGSTIGQHVRHILEFYTCLLEGRRSARIDYSARPRNAQIAERLDVALALLDYIGTTVERVDEHQWLNVDSEFGEVAERPVYISSMGRELQYAFDHAVHHLAIIRMGLETYFPEIAVDADLGVAPSTLKFRQKSVQPEVALVPGLLMNI